MCYRRTKSEPKSVTKWLTAVWSQSGQNLIEYAFILMLIALIAITISQFPTAVFADIGNVLTSFV